MRPLPHEVREYIRTARVSYRQIGDFVEKRWGRRISKGTISYYRSNGIPRTIIPRLGAITAADWDWLIGLYYADGSKFRDKWKHVIVFSLSKSDKLAIRKLLDIIQLLGLRTSILTKEGYGAINIRIYNKELFFALPHKTETYNAKEPLAFVAGLFDGDGYVGKSPRKSWVFSQASYLQLVSQVQEILSRYGKVTTTKYQRPHGWLPMYHVRILKEARARLQETEFVQYCTRLNPFYARNPD